MDIVKTNIGKLGGVIDIYERGRHRHQDHDHAADHARDHQRAGRPGRRAHFCHAAREREEAIVARPAAVRDVEGREVMTLRGSTLPLCRLATSSSARGSTSPAGTDRAPREPPRTPVAVVGTRRGARRLGLRGGQARRRSRTSSSRRSASRSRSVRGFAGATELGDQRVALVLDAPALIEEAFARR